MTAAWIAAASAAVVSLLSAFLSYRTTRRLSLRNDQLTFVARQLSELYGPLNILSRASMKSWAEFRKKYGGDHYYLFDEHTSQYSDAVQAWQYWLRNVFMPLNRKMLDALLSKADLIDEIELPKCIIDFCAHVTGYEVTLAQWQDGDLSSLGSIVNHPGASFNEYVGAKYQELKMKQTALLNSKPHLLARTAGSVDRDETQNALTRLRRAAEAADPATTGIISISPHPQSGNNLTQ